MLMVGNRMWKLMLAANWMRARRMGSMRLVPVVSHRLGGCPVHCMGWPPLMAMPVTRTTGVACVMSLLPWKLSMELHVRLGPPHDQARQRVQRHLGKAVQRQFMHLVEREVHQ